MIWIFVSMMAFADCQMTLNEFLYEPSGIQTDQQITASRQINHERQTFSSGAQRGSEQILEVQGKSSMGMGGINYHLFFIKRPSGLISVHKKGWGRIGSKVGDAEISGGRLSFQIKLYVLGALPLWVEEQWQLRGGCYEFQKGRQKLGFGGWKHYGN